MAFPASGDGRRSDRKGPRKRTPAPKSGVPVARARRGGAGPQGTGGAGNAGLRAAVAGLAGRAGQTRSTGRPPAAPPRNKRGVRQPEPQGSGQAPGDRHPQGRDATAARRASARRARSRQGLSDAQTDALRAKPAQAAACARAKGASRRRAIRPEPGVQRGQEQTREPWRSRRAPPERAPLIRAPSSIAPARGATLWATVKTAVHKRQLPEVVLERTATAAGMQ